MPKSHSKSAVRGDVGSDLEFRPHAIILTERSVPSPIFVAALIGVEKILRIDFDTSLPEETYVHQALAQIPEQTIAFGRPFGVTINYAPDRAVRYDLKGEPIETLNEAIRCGRAFFTAPPSEKDMSAGIGKALGMRFRGLFFTSTDFGIDGPYKGFSEAAEDVSLLTVTDATERIWVDYNGNPDSANDDDDQQGC